MSSNFPPEGGSEILDSTGGQPEGAPSGQSSRRAALVVGGIVGGVAVLGAAAWAATWFLSSGAEAAEVLPASTIGYVQVNLDPSGDQKIEALKTLNKFPAFKDELGLDASDDLRKSLFEQIQKDGTCSDVDYDKDIAPWLGDRVAVAAVDAGEDDPSAVLVLEVTDADKAETGLDKLQNCDASSDRADDGGDGGYVIDGDWAVVAETRDIAAKVVKDADNGTLADSTDYKHWTDEAGDDGIVTMYAAPAAGKYLGDLSQSFSESANSDVGGVSDLPLTALSDEQLQELKDFKGAAVKIRFSDGSLEAEFAGELSHSAIAEALTGTNGAEVVDSLPADTAFAFGGSLDPGWVLAIAEQAATSMGGSDTADDLIAQAEDATGLSLPEDAETLTGDSFALAVSSDIDVEAIINSGDVTGLGVGWKVKGDPDAVETVLDKIRAQTEDASILSSSTEGDFISFGPDQAWLDELVKDGQLGDNDTYRDVIPHSDRAVAVMYLNVDAGDDWLVKALETAGASDDVIDNVRPFSAMGSSSYVDGDVLHGTFKITTN